MTTEKEKQRQYWSIFMLCGISQLLDQWTRFTSPFIQGTRVSKNFKQDLFYLHSIGNCAILAGSFFIAHTIDSVGCKTSAMFAAFVTGIYQIIIPWAPCYTILIVLQLLLFANNMPMILDAMIAQILGEDGDDKERVRLITRLTIPQSLATLAPALVAQMLPYLTLARCQQLCGVLSLSLLVVIHYSIKEDYELRKIANLPSIKAYIYMLADSNMRWSLIFLTLIAAPYSAYDQALRTTLTFRMMGHPQSFAVLAVTVGVSGIITTLFILPLLQARAGPQKIIQISLFILTISYLYLGQVKDNIQLLFGTQAQMIGVCLAIGQLSAQILGQAGRGNVGKAAAMNRVGLVAAAAAAPFIASIPLFNKPFDHATLCHVSAIISFLTIPLVHFYGTFLRKHFTYLPKAHKA